MKPTLSEKDYSPGNKAQPRLWWLVIAGAVLMTLIALFWPRPKRGASTDGDALAAARPGGGSDSPGVPARIPGRYGSARSQKSLNSAEAIVADKVRRFGESRRAVAERIAHRSKKDLPPEIDLFFKAIDKGDWEEIHSRWQELATHTHQYTYSKNDRPDLEPYWATVLDAYGVAEQAHNWPAQRLLDYGNAILDSLRPGMVYVGGTDDGRFVPELMNESSGDPHIMITQNALADGSYLEYVAELYGGQLNALTEGDTSRAFQEYTADAQKRYQHDLDFPNEPKQLLPGEDVTMADGHVQVTGQTAVMAINERILQMLMAQNPNLSFAMQESYPMGGLYPDAVPLGPLMELNPQGDQGPLTSESAMQSVDYWRYATQMLLADPGSGDNSQTALTAYSKDINSTANLLAAHNFTEQAEQAYTLASKVQPDNPEPVSGLAKLLAQSGHADQAQALLDQFASQYPNQSKAALK